MELQQTSNRKFFILSGVLSGVLMILIIATFILSSTQRTNSPSAPNIASNANDTTIKTDYIPLGNDLNNNANTNRSYIPKASSLPQIGFQTWIPGPRPENTPTTSTVYTLKKNYSFDDVKHLAGLLKSGDVMKRTGDYIITYTPPGQKPAALLVFNVNTGQLSYAATTGLTFRTEDETDFNASVYKYLQEVGLYDATLKVGATYKDKSNPDITYVEVHRDWSVAGAPILNPVGLLNLPEEKTMATLDMNYEKEELPEDNAIYNTSDGRDGLNRPNDFNTITLGISDKSNSVVSLKSNIRQLAETKTDVNLISFDDAQSKLQNGEHDFILTMPSGGGDIPWDRVYQQNKATAPRATITDTFFTYLEQSPGYEQVQLSPYYIFRGYANLDNGYRISFTAAVSATPTQKKAKKFDIWSFIKQVNAQETADDDQGQKQSSFDLSPAPTLTPIPIDPNNCVPTVNQLNPVYEINGVKFGWSNIRIQNGTIKTSRKGYYYLIPGSSTTAGSLQNEVNQVIIQVRSISGENDFREFEKTLDDFVNQPTGCPLRVTGASPTLFVYGKPGTTYTIKPGGNVIYTEPVTAANGIWNVAVTNEGLDVNGYSRHYIYYEYQKMNFSKPSAGWNIKKQDLSVFTKNIAAKLQLTEQETGRLNVELNHAAFDVKGDTLFVGIIDNKELEQKIPLQVKPAVNIYRIHFYVTQGGTKSHSPALSPIQRSENMIVELGAAGY